MLSPLSPRRVISALTLVALLLAPACKTPVAQAPNLQSLDYASSHQAVENLDREMAAAGLDAAKLTPIAQRLVQLVRDPKTTPAARQAICERLNEFPAEALLAGDGRQVFASMLRDEQQFNLARLALDRVPGSAVDEIYLAALSAATPATRLGLIQSLGNRRVAAAVAPLGQLVGEADVAVAAAAVKALGQIGTDESLTALSHAPNPASAPVIEARLSAAHQLGGARANREFQAIVDNARAPANLRAAAFRGLLFGEPATAATRFIAAISGDDAVLKPVVIQAIFDHPSKDLVSALSAQLASWNAPTQVAVISALGRKGDAAAVSAVTAATRHADPDVRAAAISALGRLPGSSDVALVLARIAAGDNSDEAKLARLSLARLNGPDVPETVIAGATQGEQSLRIVFLEQLASRNMSANIPLLLATRQDPAAAVRSAALGALAEIANPSEQRAILDWAVAATDAGEQSRALRALANVTLRDPDTANRARPIIEAIESAPPAVALRLLPVLPRVGGTATAECATRLALRDDTTLSDAAITTLSRWTDLAGLLPLANVAEKTSRENARAAALQGIVRYLERSRNLPSADLTAVVSRLVPIASEPVTRSRLVYLLGRSSTADALALAKKFQADPSLAAVAADAAMIIEANRVGRVTVRASENERQVKNIIDGKTNTRWTVPATAGQWVELDFKASRPFRQLVLDNNGESWGAPQSFEVFVTDDVKNPGEARVKGSGTPGKTTVDLPANTRGRFLIIRHTAQVDDSVWAMTELIID